MSVQCALFEAYAAGSKKDFLQRSRDDDARIFVSTKTSALWLALVFESLHRPGQNETDTLAPPARLNKLPRVPRKLRLACSEGAA